MNIRSPYTNIATSSIVACAIATMSTNTVQARPISNDAGPVRILDSSDPFYTHGYLQAQGCASYTISLDGEEQSQHQETLDISVVGQETIFFLEYTLPYNINIDDDTTNDDDGSTNDDQNYRRHLGNNDFDGSYEYYNYYGSNVMLAKDWVVAFSGGAISSGCIQMTDELGVFRDIVPGIDDGSLVFSSLYYGPICAGDASNKYNNYTSAKLEMAVFLDSTCNAYVPGLSQILNEILLPEWTTGVSFRGTSDRQNNSTSVNETQVDIENLNSYKSLLRQLNFYHNYDTTNCASDPQICQEITESSVDLNTCQSLASELWKVGNGDFESNYDDNDDASMQGSASEYGEFVGIMNSDGESYDYYYHMYQTVLEDYSDCAANQYENDDCTGWNYGWGQYDCNVQNDDGTSGYYNGDNECQQGLCFGVLKSLENGYSLKEWLDANSRDLTYEMVHIYGVESPSVYFEYILVVICAVIMAFLVVVAFWTEGILRSFSSRRRRPTENKKEPFLDKNTIDDDSSNQSTGTASSLGSLGSLGTSPSNSPERFTKSTKKALYLW
eukprot:CAMPEP_0116132406 /NCGR_PEP_ID=MMETSP0329-20121206/9525_1 /TAXON_ID=697910 /ORGANISM="Pseudo-nitzschia arenysensis, Strain B593" /LENGTH=554 /DNA_ID=CAMNT_0003626907 /DNA_START=128 /DNA_END=1792 /DNA_ORIENTATION=+